MSQSPVRERATPPIDRGLLDALTLLAADASAAILSVTRDALGTTLKSDQSPVTRADALAESVILAGLAAILPGVAIVSEEAHSATGAPASLPATFLLVDPLDGTREFVAGRDEYTVNIALIEDGIPIMGVVAAPALGRIWRGARGLGASRLPLAACDRASAASGRHLSGFAGANAPFAAASAGSGGPSATPPSATPIRVRPWPADAPVAVASRSHLDAGSVALVARIPGVKSEACGSALKFCRLAEGGADFYPRLAPTSEWDVAAGHAVLSAAGGTIVRPDGSELKYGSVSSNFLIPGFIAVGDAGALAHVLPPPV